MKTKILTTENEQWLILKAENEFEKKVVKLFEGMPNTFFGEFEYNQAGYMREFKSSESLIIKFPTNKKGL